MQDNANEPGGPGASTDVDFYREHFDYMDPREPLMREDAVRSLAGVCPVVHSDAWGGFWFVNEYELVKSVYSDWETFSSVPERQFTRIPGKLARPPLDVDRPEQAEYRSVLNPFLTPARVQDFESGVRALCKGLIDTFIEDGKCDLVEQFARPFPARMLYRFLLGIDEAEIAMVQEWMMLTVFHPKDPEAASALQKWYVWIDNLIDRRRSEPRRDDILDALVHAEIGGAEISRDALKGAVMILIEGGFSTTTDSISSAMLRLAEDQDLQARLRNDPSLIAGSVDEFLRFDPPVPGAARLCTRDVNLGGVEIKQGDRVFMHMMAAHRDPKQFVDADVVDIDRSPNRHLAFGLGPHRCVGSNLARLNLRVALEELLARLGPFELAEGNAVTRQAGPTWGPTSLLLLFSGGV